MSEEWQLYRSNVWCTVRAESDLRDRLRDLSKKYFIDVLMFPLFWGKSVEESCLSTLYYPYTIYMFCIVNIVGPTVRDVIAADIILSRVMIKPDYAVRE